MRLSIYGSIRFTMLTCFAFSAVAVAVGRMATNPLESLRVDHRQPWTVPQHVFDPVGGRNLVLQTESDRRYEHDFGAGESVDLLTVSPFADPTGQREMVGRKRSVRGEGSESMPVRISMARFRFPDGKLIETRETEWLPSALPAWDVRLDKGLRTVFSTGAGFLVRLDWTDDRGLQVSHRGDKIEWGVEAPLGEATSIGEPVWVSDPRYPDRLIVNFWGQAPATGDHHVGLAWIELDRDRSRIVDCGILIDRNLGPRKNAISIRVPSIRLDENETLRLLWMERTETDRSWKLQMAPLVMTEPGPLSNDGWSLGQPVELASNCLPVPAHVDQGLRYAYFVVPKSRSCYDGAQWRKTRIDVPSDDLAMMRGDAAGTTAFESAIRH